VATLRITEAGRKALATIGKEGEAREYGTVVDAWSLPGGVAYLIRLVDGVREVLEDDIASLRHS
jgi:hypothetical protein